MCHDVSGFPYSQTDTSVTQVVQRMFSKVCFFQDSVIFTVSVATDYKIQVNVLYIRVLCFHPDLTTAYNSSQKSRMTSPNGRSRAIEIFCMGS